MQQISSTKIISGLLLFACIVQACHTATVSKAAANHQLMCYVCENCAKVTKDTPLAVCDAAYFDKYSTTGETVTDPTTSTTSVTSITSTTTEMTTDSTTTEMSSSTIPTSTETITTDSTTTTEAIPTPPTVGPLPTTTAVPTPPTVGFTIAPLDIVEKVFDAINDTTTTESTENSTINDAPKALPLVVDDYTYHCYSVQKTVNGTASMDRGCSRVTTEESVCGALKALNNGTQLSKCVPCSNSSCNGSSALGVSVAALLFALIATVLSRQ